MRIVGRMLIAAVSAVVSALMVVPVLAQSPNWWDEGYTKEASTPTHTVEYATRPDGTKTRFETNWVAGNTKFCMLGVADPRTAGGMMQAKYAARRAAEVNSLASLAEHVHGLRVRRNTTVVTGALKGEVTETLFDGFLKGVVFSPPRYEQAPDGTLAAEVCAGFDLYGQDGFLGKVIEGIPDPDPSARTGRPAPAPAPPKPHTGVIVDASGLSVRPGLVPRIVTESGKEIYGAMDVPRAYALDPGMVGYSASVDAARATKDRIGSNPLVVKALRSFEAGGIDVVVSAEDAGKILAADRDSKALSEARVVFVLN